MKTVELQQVRSVLAEHFPEWLSGYCYCEFEIPTYSTWLDHVMVEMEQQHKEKDGVAQGDSPV